ncbi:hypothetical protein [Streptomyces armeniacus]|uniref:hypothetical protein n=1 Tax=Streptomyces armeniacus TaxID=83291 RepID=UPI00319EACCA
MLLTTTTPVPAGIDRFDRERVKRHFGDDGELPGVDTAQVLRLGAESYTGGDPDVFNSGTWATSVATQEAPGHVRRPSLRGGSPRPTSRRAPGTA